MPGRSSWKVPFLTLSPREILANFFFLKSRCNKDLKFTKKPFEVIFLKLCQILAFNDWTTFVQWRIARAFRLFAPKATNCDVVSVGIRRIDTIYDGKLLFTIRLYYLV